MICSCQHYDRLTLREYQRCDADATHYLRTGQGVDLGVAYCREHAVAIVTEYREKLGWNWTMEPIEEEL